MSNLYNLICLDVDGTLLDDDKQITTFTLQELQRVSTLGVNIVLVSSRMPLSLFRIMQELSISGPMVSYNGALILDRGVDDGKTNRVLSSVPLPINAPLKLYSLVEEYLDDIHLGIFNYDGWYINKLDYWALREIRGTKVWPVVANLDLKIRECIHNRNDIYKVVIRSTADLIDEIMSKLSESKEILNMVNKSNETYIEITPSNASKSSAIRAIQEYLKVSNLQTLAFGDNSNDMGMIRYVGHGVAMGNSVSALKDCADEITLSNNEDGVGFIIRKYFPYEDDVFSYQGIV